MTTMGRVDQLTRSTPAQLATAWRHREVLVATAAALVVSAGHGRGVVRCRDASCALAATGSEPMCVVARHLSELAIEQPAVMELPLAVAAFNAALTDAVDAVRACRQTAHPVGSCWFAVGRGVDGCGDVLRLAHATG